MNGKEHFLVIGTGSIAKRHIANLKKLWPSSLVTCISSRGRSFAKEEVGADIVSNNIAEALNTNICFAIIASPAPFHLEQAIFLLNNNIPVLIEKPLCSDLDNLKNLIPALLSFQDKIAVGYNLRYLGALIKLKEILAKNMLGNISLVLTEVGQYLPSWRKDQSSYKTSVSAQKQLGGGALLELSHELDYLLWLFGPFNSVFCQLKNSGILDIDVEDKVDAFLQQDTGLTVNLHQDLLQHTPTRTCKIVGSLGTLKCDLILNKIIFSKVNGEQELIYAENNYDRNNMYLEELQNVYYMAKGEGAPKVNINEAINVMYLIAAMRDSSCQKKVENVNNFVIPAKAGI